MKKGKSLLKNVSNLPLLELSVSLFAFSGLGGPLDPEFTGSFQLSARAVSLLEHTVLNYLGDAYPEYAASVYAGNDFMRSSFGAGFPLFAAAMYNKLGVGWASSLLGFLSILFIPIPFVLYIFGKKIRLQSKRARHDI
jgi:hypothetical protein